VFATGEARRKHTPGPTFWNDTVNPMFIGLILLSAMFDFLNGMRDASNFVSTMIATRAMPLRWALWLTAFAEFCGPFLLGTRVARAFSGDLISVNQINITILFAALISATIWNVITLILKIPSSSSHAFFGGILGAIYMGAGLQAIHQAGVLKILISLLISPLIGFIVGFVLTKFVFFLARSSSPFINTYFKSAQVITGVTLAISYGANDAQKSMGNITIALLVAGYLSTFSVPTWVIVVSAGSTALGIGLGGWRLIRTLGNKFYKVRPVHGFTSQLSSVAVILIAALLGAPVSTSQVVTTSILGAGTAHRANMIRWGTFNDIVRAWLLTIPVCALLGALSYYFLTLLSLIP
jgi:inorganic phosphate transporter, PiT family